MLQNFINTYKKISIFTKVMTGLIIGILLGVVLGPSASHLEFLGTLMVRMITLVVVPLVLCMMIVTVADGGSKNFSKIGVLSTVTFMITTAVAIGIGLLFAVGFNVGSGFELPAYLEEATAQTAPTLMETLVNMVPNNIFASLTNANLMQIMFFAIITGIAISKLKDQDKAKKLTDGFKMFGEVMQNVLNFAMALTPIGVMGMMAHTVGTHGLSVLIPFASFIGVIYAATLFYVVVVQLGFMVKIMGKTSPRAFLSATKEAIAFVFATSSSFATLPLLLKSGKKLNIKDEVNSFVMPYGTVVNMDGTGIYLAIASVFIAQMHGISLTLPQMVLMVVTATLASVGTAGVPGAGVVMLNVVLVSLGLPVSAIALILGFDRIISPSRATPNVIGDAAVALIVNRFMGKENAKERIKKPVAASKPALIVE